ncbi:hypothetical protein [Deinococcus aetherius]|nr:hypothetical protein [Deinococcus aetherius]
MTAPAGEAPAAWPGEAPDLIWTPRRAITARATPPALESGNR